MFDFFSLTPERKESLKLLVEKRTTRDENGCWIYEGYPTKQGYGRVRFKQNDKMVSVLTHRLVWMLHYNCPIPGNLLCCHTCDVKACARPDHIFIGTHKMNTQDSLMKDRRSKIKREERLKIADAVMEGFTLKEVGKRFNIKPQFVHFILKNRDVVAKYGIIDLSYRCASKKRSEWKRISPLGTPQDRQS